LKLIKENIEPSFEYDDFTYLSKPLKAATETQVANMSIKRIQKSPNPTIK